MSSGPSHTQADGICRLTVDDQLVIYGTKVSTGPMDKFRLPALGRMGDPAANQGWWQIDEYEVWDGLPRAR